MTTIRFTGMDSESRDCMNIIQGSDDTKYWHIAEGLNDYTFCGLATADGQDIVSRKSNSVTCPDCIKMMNIAKKYKQKDDFSK